MKDPYFIRESKLAQQLTLGVSILGDGLVNDLTDEEKERIVRVWFRYMYDSEGVLPAHAYGEMLSSLREILDNKENPQ